MIFRHVRATLQNGRIKYQLMTAASTAALVVGGEGGQPLLPFNT